MRPPPPPDERRLPRYLTSFVGRQQEIAEITHLLLRDDVRLLTLLGAGGAGKTRLAVETVDRLDEDAWSDIWFVSLVSVRDPALVHGGRCSASAWHPATQGPSRQDLSTALKTIRSCKRFRKRPTS